MNLDQLTHHPTADLGPMLAENDPHFLAMIASIRARGLDYPVLIDSKNRIVDGRHRSRAARAAGLSEVPVRQVGDGESATIVGESLMARRHFSKSALAYLLYTLLEPIFAESRKRSLANLNGQKAQETSKAEKLGFRGVEGCKTQADVSSRLGISTDVIGLAGKIHKLFKARPDIKAEYEPLLLGGKAGFQQILAAVAGREATKGKKRVVHQQMLLWDDMVRTISNRIPYIAKITNLTMRREKLARLAQALAGLEPDDMKFFKSSIRKVEEAR
ncbi:MAG: ParB N-terminal domain-containing protein [Verrucomicrobia bacterium]|nr:ParB N-terminal domain-containing protein [Verrucomicrobiota bacterium]